MVIWTIVLFLIFRFLVKYILPVVQMTKQVRERMRHMQDQMNDAAGQKAAPGKATIDPQPRAHKEDYIDYEEIK